MKKLAIIGAGYLQYPLVKKAHEMGIETFCFAWEEGAVCKDLATSFYPISILDKDAILKKCEEIEIDGITSIASDAAVPTVCYIGEKLGLISNSFSDARMCTNKYDMRRRFCECGVACPKYAIVDDGYNLSEFTFPLVVKPVDRSGSRGVSIVYNDIELQIAIAQARKESFSGSVIVEEYIDGIEVSVETISWRTEHFILAITDKVTTGAPHFVELAHHQPSLLSSGILDCIREETIKSLNALNIQYGASHAEFKISESGKVFAIETGARMGGDFIGSDLVCLSTGFDFLAAVIDVSLGFFLPPMVSNKFHSGVYFLSKNTERLLPLFHSQEHYDWLICKAITKPQLSWVNNSADRSGYLLYQSDKRIIL